MKKNSILLYLTVFLVGIAQSMQHPVWGHVHIFTVTSWLAIHGYVTHENHAVLPLSQVEQVKEYPHQPNQNFRVKKTQQPYLRSRRQFSQHHK